MKARYVLFFLLNALFLSNNLQATNNAAKNFLVKYFWCCVNSTQESDEKSQLIPQTTDKSPNYATCNENSDDRENNDIITPTLDKRNDDGNRNSSNDCQDVTTEKNHIVILRTATRKQVVGEEKRIVTRQIDGEPTSND